MLPISPVLAPSRPVSLSQAAPDSAACRAPEQQQVNHGQIFPSRSSTSTQSLGLSQAGGVGPGEMLGDGEV